MRAGSGSNAVPRFAFWWIIQKRMGDNLTGTITLFHRYFCAAKSLASIESSSLWLRAKPQFSPLMIV
jgi:hypothetical protein